jgi:hypothetical protein
VATSYGTHLPQTPELIRHILASHLVANQAGDRDVITGTPAAPVPASITAISNIRRDATASDYRPLVARIDP